jgi:N-dimethylarginine dimethylaminohydrolase
VADYGVRSSVSRLRWAALRRPAVHGDFAGAGWRQPDPGRLLAQHEAFAEVLAGLGVSVSVLDATEDEVDACFTYDPVFVTGTGAVVFRAAKPARAAEGERLAADLSALGVPTVAGLSAPATADGGDFCWLARDFVVGGRGYRTNQAAHDQLGRVLAGEGQQLYTVDLPHGRGPASVLHLMSCISPVADDLAVVFEPIAPVPLLQALAERGIAWVAVDRDEYKTLAANVLAVAPGVVVMFDGNPRTRRALEARGVEVHAVVADELAKGDGGPTCLARPLLRD